MTQDLYSIFIILILIHVLICCETVYAYLEDNIRKKYKESASVDVGCKGPHMHFNN